MARPRVYASFDASHSKNPATTDLKYYFLLRAWLQRGPLAGAFVDVHDGSGDPRPRKLTSQELENELRRRLQASDLLLLILSERSRTSRGWLEWEIREGAGRMGLPVLCAYVGLGDDLDAEHGHGPWWPGALIEVRETRPDLPIRHVPFRARALAHWSPLRDGDGQLHSVATARRRVTGAAEVESMRLDEPPRPRT